MDERKLGEYIKGKGSDCWVKRSDISKPCTGLGDTSDDVAI